MRLLDPRSRVRTDDAGWVWLEPERSSLRARHAASSFVLAVLVLAGMAASAFLTQPLALAVVVALVGASGWIIVVTTRTALTRAACGDVGVVVQSGATVLQAGWPSVTGVWGEPRGRRVRITLAAGREQLTGVGTFDLDAAREWLERCAAEARRRNIDGVPGPQGLGFRP